MPKRRRRKPRVATGGNTDNRRRRDRDSYSTHTHTLQSEIPTREKRENLGYFEKSGAARELTTNLCCQEALQQTALVRPCAPKNNSFLFLHPSGGGCMPRPRISRRGESFQHAVQAQRPKTCLLIVFKDCIFTPEQSAGRLLGSDLFALPGTGEPACSE